MFWSDIMYDIVGLPLESPPLDFSQYLLLVRPESRDIVRSTFKRLLTAGGKYNQEYEIVRPDGQTRAVRAEAEAVLDDDGSVIRILGSVHDQTSVKRVESALREAKEAAVTANNAKSEFLANISHELRTPLNAVIGFSEVMIQEVFGPIGSDRYRDYAGDIRQSGVHLLGVINDLLDYSKLEAGRVELHVEDISPATIMDKCYRMMRQRAEVENLTLLTDTGDATDAVIQGDDRKITQVMLNLVSNAIKFTPAGGIIRLSICRSGNGDGDGVDILVADSGIGMSENDIGLALAPFGQVNSSLNREYTGTGLGLPLSKSLIELHGVCRSTVRRARVQPSLFTCRGVTRRATCAPRCVLSREDRPDRSDCPSSHPVSCHAPTRSPRQRLHRDPGYPLFRLRPCRDRVLR